MMKKTIATLIVAGLAATSGFSHAADDTVTQLSTGVYVENTTAGCSILRDRVTVTLSTGVTAAYNCLTASNKVNLGGCHSAGSQKPTLIDCKQTGTDVDTGDPIYNGEDCTPAGQLTNPIQQTSIDGRRAYIADTAGGSVGATNLNSETCEIGAIEGLTSMTK